MDKRTEPCKKHTWGIGTILPNGRGTLRLCRFCEFGQHRPAHIAVGFRTLTPEEVRKYTA